MELVKIKVKGQLRLNLTFKKRNIILGENRTGKSTLMNLILYSLGGRIDNFIDEIKSGLCKQVELDIKCKSGRAFRIIRSLPKSEVVSVIPFDDFEQLLENEIELMDLSDFSDFILNEEGYHIQKISYGKNQNASLRFYFLLRAIFVDQDTPASAVLANIGGEDSGYLNNQKLIKKAIVEEFLGKENYQIQKIRFQLQNLTKERQIVQGKLNITKEMIDRQIEKNNVLVKNIDKIRIELDRLAKEKKQLDEAKTQQLVQLAAVNEKYNEEDLQYLKEQKESILSNIRTLKLELYDLDQLLKELKQELEQLKKKYVARQILTQIPIDKCPICLTNHDFEINDDRCPICKETLNNNNEQAFRYKKMLEETYKESTYLIKELKKELILEKKHLDKIDKQINKKRIEYIENLKELKTPIDEVVNTITNKYEDIIRKEELYKHFLESLEYEKELIGEKADLAGEISELRDELSDLEKNDSVSDIEKITIWQSRFSSTLKFIFGDVANITLDENYQPVIDGANLVNVSSASLKVAARLSYILSLFDLKDETEINHLGFILFDSPKDKDLDTNKYRRFLELISEIGGGQVIITGSSEERYLYEDLFEVHEFLLDLDPDKK
ncbi:hypothetical protein P4G69_29955, partial [Bacillus cereus]|nr:hypothetical protein [Bacillus cereus]